MTPPSATRDADVVVVGAGPAGSSTAYHLARTGLDVALLEKTAFPREKVCGDGLTPRAVRSLVAMGLDTSEQAGWVHNKGLRIIGGGMRLEIPWPELASYPSYGLVRPRTDFDDLLARQAVKAGALLHERTNGDRPAARRPHRADHRRHDGTARNGEVTYRAPVVVAADGNSSRLALAMGLQKRDDRPMGVAVRTYYTSPRHDDDWLESWLELWDSGPGTGGKAGCCRATAGSSGWATARPTSGSASSTPARRGAGSTTRTCSGDWLDQTPEEWGFREENRTQPVRGAALPMGFNRQPHYTRGLLLVGDSGGMVNPFNGEGIAYAMESGEIAAQCIAQALARPTADGRERALQAYPQVLKQTYGGYYTVGRLFVKAIGDDRVMKLATRHGLPHPS